MRENRLRRIWSEGQTATGLLLLTPSAYSAEVLAHQGWDFLFVDMQHGAIDERAATDMLTAISTTDTTPLVRVPGRDPGMVRQDAGCGGLWHHLSHDRQRRGSPKIRGSLPLSAPGKSQLRSFSGTSLRGSRLSRARQ